MYENLSNDLREKVAYDSREQPLYVRHSTLSQYGPNMAALCHWHEDVEFLSIIRGYMEYHVNGTVYHLEEGNGIFVNSRQLHFGCSADRTDCEFLCILLNPLLLSSSMRIERRYIAPLTSNRFFPCMPLDRDHVWQSEILECLRQIWTVYAAAGDAFEMKLQILFYHIWISLWRNMSENGGGSAPHRIAPRFWKCCGICKAILRKKFRSPRCRRRGAYRRANASSFSGNAPDARRRSI